MFKNAIIAGLLAGVLGCDGELAPKPGDLTDGERAAIEAEARRVSAECERDLAECERDLKEVDAIMAKWEDADAPPPRPMPRVP